MLDSVLKTLKGLEAGSEGSGPKALLSTCEKPLPQAPEAAERRPAALTSPPQETEIPLKPVPK